MKPRKQGARAQPGNGKTMARATSMLDALAEFEEFKREILPALALDIKNGVPPKELREKWLAYAAARQISLALTCEDESIALAAIKDLQDRCEGKSVERKEIAHKHGNLKEDQLNAALLSAFDELDEISDDKTKH